MTNPTDEARPYVCALRLVAFILIITIPFGIAAFRLAGFVIWPFGRTTVFSRNAGVWSVIGNVIWLVVVGWELALAHLVAALLLCLTIIGIPFGIAGWKMVTLALLLALLLASPMLLFGLVAGLAISIFQAVTQIQEQTLSFIPKIVAMVAAAIALAPMTSVACLIASGMRPRALSMLRASVCIRATSILPSFCCSLRSVATCSHAR